MIEKNDLSFGTDKIISVANMYYKEDISNSDDDYMRTYNVMRLGDIAFEGNKSKNFAHGRFVENTIGDGIVSHVFDVFRPISEYDLLFWKYFINYEGVMGRIMIRCTKASTMMTNLVAKDFLEESIVVPGIVEQKRIGYYLESIDHLITLHQSKSFGHISEVIVSCTLSWEQRKFGEIGSVAMCRRVFKYQTAESGDIPFFKIGSFGATPDAFISKDLFENLKIKYPYPEKGDVLISASGSIGRTVVFTGKDEYFQDSNIVWLKHDNSIINPFLNYLYSIVKWIGIEGTTIKRLYNDNILKTEVIIPTLSEQQKISNYLDGIDHLITLHQLEPFQLIFKAIAYRIIDYAKSKPPRCRKYTGLIAFIKYYV